MPTSWNVTPHRYGEHGSPATTGYSVLDLSTELGEHAARIMQGRGKAWLKGKLLYYGEKSGALFRPPGVVLAKAPDRAAQLMSETLLRQVAKDLRDMDIESEASYLEQMREANDQIFGYI